MKSIMQEASSLIKAIEQGWQKAGKPQEFSVKVFQEGSRNFLGMTIQPAKIAIFFDNVEKASVKKDTKQAAPRPEQKVTKKPAHDPAKQPVQSPAPTKTPIVVEKQERAEAHEPRVFWTDEMVNNANDWLKTMLQAMNAEASAYSSKVLNNQLRIVFSKPLHIDEEKERQLYRSFSLLMLQALRHKLQRPLRGFKVVILTENA